MNNISKEIKITIKVKLIIPLQELAIYILKRRKENSVLLDTLNKNPEKVNQTVKRITRGVLRIINPNVRLKQIKFSYYDSVKFIYGSAYFDAKLRGTEKELRKVAGVNKIFQYDWENLNRD